MSDPRPFDVEADDLEACIRETIAGFEALAEEFKEMLS